MQTQFIVHSMPMDCTSTRNESLNMPRPGVEPETLGMGGHKNRYANEAGCEYDYSVLMSNIVNPVVLREQFTMNSFIWSMEDDL
jgi:hypothetical protein